MATEPRIGSIMPAPTDEEVAAIAAAVAELWPRPVADPSAARRTDNTWRFSGRWWVHNPVARRGRPGA